MTTHTPGPWDWDHGYTNSIGEPTWSLLGADGYGILSCDEENSPQGINNPENARLIAAAPELLEALEALANYDAAANGDKSLLDRDDLWSAAEAAIDKATGVQP